MTFNILAIGKALYGPDGPFRDVVRGEPDNPDCKCTQAEKFYTCLHPVTGKRIGGCEHIKLEGEKF